MRPQVITASDTDTNGVMARLNYRERDFKVGFGVVRGGTTTYSVQVCFEDPANYSSTADYLANAAWFDHDSVVGETSNQSGNIAVPVQSVRLIVTAGAGSVTGTFLQAT